MVAVFDGLDSQASCFPDNIKHGNILTPSVRVTCICWQYFTTGSVIVVSILHGIDKLPRYSLWIKGGDNTTIASVPLFFPNFSAFSKHTLAIEDTVYIWQVSPQLICGGTSQIWMCFKQIKR